MRFSNAPGSHINRNYFSFQFSKCLEFLSKKAKEKSVEFNMQLNGLFWNLQNFVYEDAPLFFQEWKKRDARLALMTRGKRDLQMERKIYNLNSHFLGLFDEICLVVFGKYEFKCAHEVFRKLVSEHKKVVFLDDNPSELLSAKIQFPHLITIQLVKTPKTPGLSIDHDASSLSEVTEILLNKFSEFKELGGAKLSKLYKDHSAS